MKAHDQATTRPCPMVAAAAEAQAGAMLLVLQQTERDLLRLRERMRFLAMPATENDCQQAIDRIQAVLRNVEGEG